MKITNCLVLVAFLIASCSFAPSAKMVQTAIAQTQAAQPTNTLAPKPIDTTIPLPPTPIPLVDMDLASILIQPGDLPAGYTGAQVRGFLPRMFDDITQPTKQIYQEFEKNNDNAGGVAVIIYDSSDVAIKAYNTILDGMDSHVQAVLNLGERAKLSTMTINTIMGTNAMDLLFLQCSTVVHIRMTAIDEQDYIISYAQRLDARLTPLVCR
jgi:hypothetical protein